MAEWAKLHTDILSDPKLMRASRKGAKALLYLPWLIAFAKRADDGGRLTVNSEPAETDDYLQSIPCSTEKTLSNALDELEKLGILARELDGALSFSAWSRRQTRPSDEPEAVRERVKRHRASRKPNKTNEPVTSGNDVTGSTSNEGEGDIEEEGDSARVVTDTAERGGWPARLAGMYEPVGSLPPGRIGSALKRLVTRYGERRVTDAWGWYVQLAPFTRFGEIAETRDTSRMSPHDFVKNFGTWDAKEHPATDPQAVNGGRRAPAPT